MTERVSKWVKTVQSQGDYGVPNTCKQLSWEWEVSSTHNALTPQACPLSAPNILHVVLEIFCKESKFCISSIGEEIQALQKAFRERTGKHSQNQHADGPFLLF